jgi:hypothetical protein
VTGRILREVRRCDETIRRKAAVVGAEQVNEILFDVGDDFRSAVVMLRTGAGMCEDFGNGTIMSPLKLCTRSHVMVLLDLRPLARPW